jgi:hypothetical protein
MPLALGDKGKSKNACRLHSVFTFFVVSLARYDEENEKVGSGNTDNEIAGKADVELGKTVYGLVRTGDSAGN